MKMSTRHGLLFLAVILLLGMAVCGWGEGQGEAGKPAEKVHLVFMDPMVPPYRQEVMEDMAKQFMEANPNIELELQATSSWPEQRTKLMTAVAAGTGPDVFSQNTDSYYTYAAEGIMEDLGPYFAKDPKVNKEDFYVPLMQACEATVDGKAYAIPICATLMVTFYNKDLFAKAGVAEPPKTMDEFRDAGMAVAKLGGGVVGFATFSKVKLSVHAWMVDNLYPAGETLFNDDFTKVKFNSAKGVKALQDQVDNIQKYKFQAPLGTESNDLFARGLAGMSTFWPFIYGYIETNAPELNWGAIPVPVGDLGKKITGANMIVQCLLADGKHNEEAWKWISFMGADDGHFEYNKRRNHLPAKPALAETEYYQNHAAWKVFLAEVPNSRMFPAEFPGFLESMNILNEEIENALLMKKSPKQALDDAAAKVQPFLN